MNELVNLLPDIILYIVLGYVFIRVFKFICAIENNTEYKHVFVESLITGFVLNNVFRIIPFSLGKYLDIIGMTIGSIILGYVSAFIFNSECLQRIFRFLKIKQTTNKYIWADIADKDCGTYISLYNKNKNEYIEGSVILFESFERKPIVQITKIRKTVNGNVVLDYTQNTERTLIVDTSKYDEIFVTYAVNSSKIKH